MQLFSRIFLGLLIFSTNLNGETIKAIELPQTNKFIQYMVDKHGFIKKELDLLFTNIELTIKKPSKQKDKITKKRVNKVLWSNYQKLFITNKRINEGVEFYHKNKKYLNKAYQDFGVSPYIITAILGIETNYGEFTGEYLTLQTLSSLAFGKNRRQKFYAKELEQFLLLVRDNAIPPLKVKGSHAGAMGAAQFISSSYNYYAIDYNADNKVDLFNIVDSIGSIANYLKKHYWQKDGEYYIQINANNLSTTSTSRPINNAKYFRENSIKINKNIADDIKLSLIKITDKKNDEDANIYLASFWNFYAITRYNRDNMYALAVIELAKNIEKRVRNEKNNIL